MDSREAPDRRIARPCAVIGRRDAHRAGPAAEYYVDAKRAILRPRGFLALASSSPRAPRELGATAVGGMTMGADPVACAALAGGADVKAFFVRKEAKQHGLARRDRGPAARAPTAAWSSRTSCTTGGSTLAAIEALGGRAARSSASSRSSTACRRRRAHRAGRGRALPRARHDRRRLPGAAGSLSGVGRPVSAPTWIRTRGLLLRREPLYPAELSGRGRIVRAAGGGKGPFRGRRRCSTCAFLEKAFVQRTAGFATFRRN